MADAIETLKEALRVLRVNEENLTQEQKEGKYKNALNRKRQEVIDAMCNIVNDWLPGGCRLKTEQDAAMFTSQYNKYIDDNWENIRSAVMPILEHYNYEKVLEDLIPYKDYIFNMIYGEIFQAHCVNLNGRIYNDILQMFWYPEFNCWAIKQKEGGTSFCMYPTPVLATAA